MDDLARLKGRGDHMDERKEKICVNVSPEYRDWPRSRSDREPSRGYTHLVIDFREYRSQLFAGFSSSNSHSIVAGLYKFRSAILSVFLRPRDESLERDIERLYVRSIVKESPRYCRLYVERGTGVSCFQSSLLSFLAVN